MLEGLKFREERGRVACERTESAKGGELDNQPKPSSSAGLHTSLWDESYTQALPVCPEP